MTPADRERLRALCAAYNAPSDACPMWTNVHQFALHTEAPTAIPALLDALEVSEAETARLRAGIEAALRANDPKGACLPECASWNDYDDCDCGYVEAGDDLWVYLVDLIRLREEHRP